MKKPANFTAIEFIIGYNADEINGEKPAIIPNEAYASFVDQANITYNGKPFPNGQTATSKPTMDTCAFVNLNPCRIYIPFEVDNSNPFFGEDDTKYKDVKIVTIGLTSLITENTGNLDIYLSDGMAFTAGGTVQPNEPGANFEIQPVPGPLPLLGLGAAFGYSRKLRKRLNISKSPKGTSIN